MKPVPFQFGDRIHIDMLNMPHSVEGHVAIFTAVDAATGFVFAKACYDKTSNKLFLILVGSKLLSRTWVLKIKIQM